MDQADEESGVSGPAHPVLSPLSGAYLLIVMAEPMSEQHKEKMILKMKQGLQTWDLDSSYVDFAAEVEHFVNASPVVEEMKGGERLIQFATSNLVIEVLIHPQVYTLQQCLKNMLSSFTKHRHFIHAGYTFSGSGGWALQDGTFTFSEMVKIFDEYDVQRVIRAYENSISIDIHCCQEGEWNQEKVNNEKFVDFCKVRLNPPSASNPLSDSNLNKFSSIVEPNLIPQSVQQSLPPSDVVGNIRFTHPTLYIFPGGQGDSALFGINGFNMLIDGGFSRRSCFWDFSKHLDRLDAVLITHLGDDNSSGMSSLLKRKAMSSLYPQIGHVFTNLPKSDGESIKKDENIDELLINVIEEGNFMLNNLAVLNLRPQICVRERSACFPINLYHKVGHGQLDMYVLNPSKDAKELQEFMERWNENAKTLGNFKSGVTVNGKEIWLPLANLVSICALLIWIPDHPEETVTRLLFPGSAPQNKVLRGLERLKHLECVNKQVCLAGSMQRLKKSDYSRSASMPRARDASAWKSSSKPLRGESLKRETAPWSNKKDKADANLNEKALLEQKKATPNSEKKKIPTTTKIAEKSKIAKEKKNLEAEARVKNQKTTTKRAPVRSSVPASRLTENKKASKDSQNNKASSFKTSKDMKNKSKKIESGKSFPPSKSKPQDEKLKQPSKISSKEPSEGEGSNVEKENIEEQEQSIPAEATLEKEHTNVEDDTEPELLRIKDEDEDHEVIREPDIVQEDAKKEIESGKKEIIANLTHGKLQKAQLNIKTPDEVDDLPDYEAVEQDIDASTKEKSAPCEIKEQESLDETTANISQQKKDHVEPEANKPEPENHKENKEFRNVCEEADPREKMYEAPAMKKASEESATCDSKKKDHAEIGNQDRDDGKETLSQLPTSKEDNFLTSGEVKQPENQTTEVINQAEEVERDHDEKEKVAEKEGFEKSEEKEMEKEKAESLENMPNMPELESKQTEKDDTSVVRDQEKDSEKKSYVLDNVLIENTEGVEGQMIAENEIEGTEKLQTIIENDIKRPENDRTEVKVQVTEDKNDHEAKEDVTQEQDTDIKEDNDEKKEAENLEKLQSIVDKENKQAENDDQEVRDQDKEHQMDLDVKEDIIKKEDTNIKAENGSQENTQEISLNTEKIQSISQNESENLDYDTHESISKDKDQSVKKDIIQKKDSEVLEKSESKDGGKEISVKTEVMPSIDKDEQVQKNLSDDIKKQKESHDDKDDLISKNSGIKEQKESKEDSKEYVNKIENAKNEQEKIEKDAIEPRAQGDEHEHQNEKENILGKDGFEVLVESEAKKEPMREVNKHVEEIKEHQMVEDRENIQDLESKFETETAKPDLEEHAKNNEPGPKESSVLQRSLSKERQDDNFEQDLRPIEGEIDTQEMKVCSENGVKSEKTNSEDNVTTETIQGQETQVVKDISETLDDTSEKENKQEANSADKDINTLSKAGNENTVPQIERGKMQAERETIVKEETVDSTVCQEESLETVQEPNDSSRDKTEHSNITDDTYVKDVPRDKEKSLDSKNVITDLIEPYREDYSAEADVEDKTYGEEHHLGESFTDHSGKSDYSKQLDKTQSDAYESVMTENEKESLQTSEKNTESKNISEQGLHSDQVNLNSDSMREQGDFYSEKHMESLSEPLDNNKDQVSEILKISVNDDDSTEKYDPSSASVPNVKESDSMSIQTGNNEDVQGSQIEEEISSNVDGSSSQQTNSHLPQETKNESTNIEQSEMKQTKESNDTSYESKTITESFKAKAAMEESQRDNEHKTELTEETRDERSEVKDQGEYSTDIQEVTKEKKTMDTKFQPGMVNIVQDDLTKLEGNGLSEANNEQNKGGKVEEKISVEEQKDSSNSKSSKDEDITFTHSEDLKLDESNKVTSQMKDDSALRDELPIEHIKDPQVVREDLKEDSKNKEIPQKEIEKEGKDVLSELKTESAEGNEHKENDIKSDMKRITEEKKERKETFDENSRSLDKMPVNIEMSEVEPDQLEDQEEIVSKIVNQEKQATSEDILKKELEDEKEEPTNDKENSGECQKNQDNLVKQEKTSDDTQEWKDTNINIETKVEYDSDQQGDKVMDDAIKQKDNKDNGISEETNEQTATEDSINTNNECNPQKIVEEEKPLISIETEGKQDYTSETTHVKSEISKKDSCSLLSECENLQESERKSETMTVTENALQLTSNNGDKKPDTGKISMVEKDEESKAKTEQASVKVEDVDVTTTESQKEDGSGDAEVKTDESMEKNEDSSKKNCQHLENDNTSKADSNNPEIAILTQDTVPASASVTTEIEEKVVSKENDDFTSQFEKDDNNQNDNKNSSKILSCRSTDQINDETKSEHVTHDEYVSSLKDEKVLEKDQEQSHVTDKERSNIETPATDQLQEVKSAEGPEEHFDDVESARDEIPGNSKISEEERSTVAFKDQIKGQADEPERHFEYSKEDNTCEAKNVHNLETKQTNETESLSKSLEQDHQAGGNGHDISAEEKGMTTMKQAESHKEVENVTNRSVQMIEVEEDQAKEKNVPLYETEDSDSKTSSQVSCQSEKENDQFQKVHDLSETQDTNVSKEVTQLVMTATNVIHSADEKTENNSTKCSVSSEPNEQKERELEEMDAKSEVYLSNLSQSVEKSLESIQVSSEMSSLHGVSEQPKEITEDGKEKVHDSEKVFCRNVSASNLSEVSNLGKSMQDTANRDIVTISSGNKEYDNTEVNPQGEDNQQGTEDISKAESHVETEQMETDKNDESDKEKSPDEKSKQEIQVREEETTGDHDLSSNIESLARNKSPSLNSEMGAISHLVQSTESIVETTLLGNASKQEYDDKSVDAEVEAEKTTKREEYEINKLESEIGTLNQDSFIVESKIEESGAISKNGTSESKLENECIVNEPKVLSQDVSVKDDEIQDAKFDETDNKNDCNITGSPPFETKGFTEEESASLDNLNKDCHIKEPATLSSSQFSRDRDGEYQLSIGTSKKSSDQIDDEFDDMATEKNLKDIEAESKENMQSSSQQVGTVSGHVPGNVNEQENTESQDIMKSEGSEKGIRANVNEQNSSCSEANQKLAIQSEFHLPASETEREKHEIEAKNDDNETKELASVSQQHESKLEENCTESALVGTKINEKSTKDCKYAEEDSEMSTKTKDLSDVESENVSTLLDSTHESSVRSSENKSNGESGAVSENLVVEASREKESDVKEPLRRESSSLKSETPDDATESSIGYTEGIVAGVRDDHTDDVLTSSTPSTLEEKTILDTNVTNESGGLSKMDQCQESLTENAKNEPNNSATKDSRSLSLFSDESQKEIPPMSPKSELTPSPNEEDKKFPNVSKESVISTCSAEISNVTMTSKDTHKAVSDHPEGTMDIKKIAEKEIEFGKAIQTTKVSDRSTTVTGSDYETEPEYRIIRLEQEDIPKEMKEETVTDFYSHHHESSLSSRSEEHMGTHETKVTSVESTELSLNAEDIKDLKLKELELTKPGVDTEVTETKDNEGNIVRTTTTYVTTVTTSDPEKLRELLAGGSKDGAVGSAISVVSTSPRVTIEETKQSQLDDESKVEKITKTIESWGEPLGLPSPVPPESQVSSEQQRAKKSQRKTMKPVSNPVYLDLAYVPHHGDALYTDMDFFRRVRARYYVFSGIDPSREVFDALLAAKKEWDEKDMEVTIIPTYDTDVLAIWVAEKESELVENKIDLAPAASRCSINLQDHETSCSAYRLEF